MVALLLVASLGTVSVTNHLGHVMTGELSSVTNGNFTLAGRTMPLKALPEGEQRRLVALAGGDVRTSRERLMDRFRDARLKRIGQLRQEGRLTPDKAAAHAAALETALKVSSRGAEK